MHTNSPHLFWSIYCMQITKKKSKSSTIIDQKKQQQSKPLNRVWMIWNFHYIIPDMKKKHPYVEGKACRFVIERLPSLYNLDFYMIILNPCRSLFYYTLFDPCLSAHWIFESSITWKLILHRKHHDPIWGICPTSKGE